MQDEGKLVAAEENVECGFVIKAVVEAAEHVKVDHGEGGGKRTDGMSGEVVRAEQAAFFSGEHHKKKPTVLASWDSRQTRAPSTMATVPEPLSSAPCQVSARLMPS